jgi:hypothetical protein
MPIAATGFSCRDQDHRRALQSSPTNCHEQTVTTSDFADVSMQSCRMGAPQLAEWMQHPTERLAAWRCVIGRQDGRGAKGGKQLSRMLSTAYPAYTGSPKKGFVHQPVNLKKEF